MVKLENKKKIKVVILGGTFDPAHKGHLEISKQAKKLLNLKNVIWAITKQNPFKDISKSNLKNRIQFAKKLIAKNDFIKIFENGFTNKVKSDKNKKSFYWPRLNTDKDGFINWHWSAKEIVDFCNAFDEPFGGASSYVSGSRMRFKNVQTDDEDVYFHPYQFGLVYRKDNNSIWIACKDGGIKVNNITNEDGINIKLGDRFLNTKT